MRDGDEAADHHVSDALRSAIPIALHSLSRTFPSVGRHLAVLDGLRGIAVLLVIFSHASLKGIDMIPGIDMSGTGKVGVWLFFVLSSFLLMHQFLHLDASGRLDGRVWWRYAVRRVLRIYPLYLVFLLVCWLAPLQTYMGQMTASDVLAHLAVVEGRWHTWSIAVEVKYYLLLPLLVIAYIHVARRRLVLATLFTAIGIGIREWLPPEFDRDGLWTYIAIFLIGSWVAIAHHHLVRRETLIGQASQRGATVIALILFALLMTMTPSVWGRIHDTPIPLNYWHQSFALFGVLWGALLLCLLQAQAWLQKSFAWLPLRVAGVVSFSAYLWHEVVMVNLGWVPFEAGSAGQATIVFMVIALVSVTSYLVIERPFLKVGRTFGDRTRAPSREIATSTGSTPN